MDMAMVFGILFVLCALAGAFTLKALKDSGRLEGLDSEDITDIMDYFDLTMDMAKELGLTKESLVMTIAEVIDLAMEFVADNIDQNDPNLRNACEDFAFGLCEQFKVEMTVERQEMMEKLIDIGLHQMNLVKDV